MKLMAFQAVGGISSAQKLIEDVIQLLTKEYGNNRRRSLMCTQTMVISYIGSRFPEKIGMNINRLQDAGENQQELAVLVGAFARIQKIDAVIGSQGSVVMFTGAIDTGKGFLVEQAYQTLLCSDSL